MTAKTAKKAGKRPKLDVEALAKQFVRPSFLARAACVTLQTLRDWQHEGLPAEKDARGRTEYRLGVALQWIMRRRIKGWRRRDELAAAAADELRYKRAKVILAEMDVKQRRRELIATAAVARGHRRRVTALKRAFGKLGRSLAPCVGGRTPAEVQKLIDGRCRRIIMKLAGQRDDGEEHGGLT